MMSRVEKQMIGLEYDLIEQLEEEKKNGQEMFGKIKDLAIKTSEKLFNED